MGSVPFVASVVIVLRLSADYCLRNEEELSERRI